MFTSSDSSVSGDKQPTSTGSEARAKSTRFVLSELLPRLAEQMAAAVNADASVLYVYGRDRTSTLAAIRYGYGDRLEDFTQADDSAPMDIPIEATILETGQTVRRRTPGDWKRWPLKNPKLLEVEQRLTDVAVPLIWRDEIKGVIYVWRRGDPEPFSDAEVARLEDLARIAAMAIDSAQGLADERILRRRLSNLLSVAGLVDARRTVGDVLPELTMSIRSAIDADVCNLYVMGETPDEVRWAFSSGLDESERWAYEHSMSYAVTDVPVEDRIRHTLKPEIVTDFHSALAPESELIDYAVREGLRAILVAPIVHRNKMIGSVYVWYRDRSRSFTDDDISTIEAMTSSAGGVVARARLNEQWKRHSKESEALLRIGQAVLESDELEPVLDEIAAALSDAVNFDYCCVGFISQDGRTVDVAHDWGDYASTWQGFQIPLEHSLTGEAIRSGNLLSITRPRDDPRSVRYNTAVPELKSLMIAPLLTERGPIGALCIGKVEIDAYDDQHEQMLALLAQQAAMAVDRIRTRQQLERRAQQKTFLASTSDMLVSERSIASTLEQVARNGCGVLADGVAIALTTWQLGVLEWSAVAHRDQSVTADLQATLRDAPLASYASVLEQILNEGQTRFLDVSSLQQTEAALCNALTELGVRSVLGVVMKREGRAAGLMLLFSSGDQGSFDDETIEVAQVVSERIAEALDLRSTVRSQEALLRVAQAVTSTVHFEELIAIFERELKHVLPCDQVFLSTLSDTSTYRDTILIDTPWLKSKRPSPMPIDLGLTGIAVRKRAPILDNNAHLNPESFYPDEEVKRRYKEIGESIIVAPLIAEGHIVGSLFISRDGVNRFTQADFETFMLFAGMAAAAIERTRLQDDIRGVYRASVEVLAAAVDAKDSTTLEHSRNVSYYSERIARRMGFSEDEVERIGLAGLLHDIGKLGIPDHILTKPGPLTPDERTIVKTHPERGAKILEQHPALSQLVPLVRHHHEWMNGSGYPEGLSGDQIPIGAQIIAVAEAFDTMIVNRTYRAGYTVEHALSELTRCVGFQFDTNVVQEFVSEVRAFPHIVRHGSSKMVMRD